MHPSMGRLKQAEIALEEHCKAARPAKLRTLTGKKLGACCCTEK
jgi:hypothetical protein